MGKIAQFFRGKTKETLEAVGLKKPDRPCPVCGTYYPGDPGTQLRHEARVHGLRVAEYNKLLKSREAAAEDAHVQAVSRQAAEAGAPMPQTGDNWRSAVDVDWNSESGPESGLAGGKQN